jgi:signal transduction histidine kinase/ActR/RegA family two-component response regulator
MDIVDIRYDFDGGSYIMDSINAGNRFGRVGNSGIEPSYFIAAPMSNVNWNLIAIIPIEATEDIIASSLWTIMGSFFILLAVLAVIVVFFVSKLTKSEEVSRVKEQAANSAKSRFLSNMSHEIRTPMSAIIGMASIAKNTEDILKKDDCIDKIEKASRHLLGVVNQILDISKIEAERFTLDLHTFCFEKMIEEVISVLSFSIEEKGLDFDVSQDKKIPRHIISDEVRLAQVCANLLSNAVKFTPKGGKISLLTNFIESERNIRVEVADTGIGISKEQQFLLFNDFVQVESDASRRFAGTGLGLAISKRIVEMLGGSIWIESEPGKGSRFIFSIPAHIGDEESMSLQTGSNFTMSGRPEAKIGKGYTVLVVEDVDINREIAGNLLESTGIDIEYAFNGAQAVQMFGDKPESYDIIFMDIQMPGMDGIAATHLIRQLGTEKSKSIPIIAMTANVFREDVDRFIKAGMNDHLSKPLELSQIYTMLQKYFTKE